jgi:hypothetical protein
MIAINCSLPCRRNLATSLTSRIDQCRNQAAAGCRSKGNCRADNMMHTQEEGSSQMLCAAGRRPSDASRLSHSAQLTAGGLALRLDCIGELGGLSPALNSPMFMAVKSMPKFVPPGPMPMTGGSAPIDE